MEMSKGKQFLLIAALLSANIAVMGDNAIYPIIANIYGTFPEQIGMVNYVISGPLIVIFIVSLAASRLFNYFSKKTVMVAGGVLFAASSIFGVAVENIYYMMVMRTIYGMSIALVNVAAVALIAEVYTVEEKRNWMMGIFNGAMAVFGTVASLCSGVLAVERWQGAYRYYYISIPMVILFLLFVPNMKDSQSRQEASENGKQVKEPYSIQFWITIVIVALVTLCFNIVANFASTYVAEHQLGDTATAGMVSAVCTVGSMVFSISFGALYGKCRKNLLAVSSVMLAVSFAIMYFTVSLPMTYVAMFLMGGAYGIALAFSYAHGAILAPTRVDDAIGIATAAYAIAGFVSTYAVTGLMSLMNTDLITPIFIVPMIAAAVITLVYPAVTAKQKN